MKVGIDIGGSHVSIGLISPSGKIICKNDRELNNNLKQKNFEKILVEALIKQIEDVLEKSKTDITKVSLIGIAVPGMVSKESIIKAENLHIKDFNISKEINKYYNVPIKLKNDAKCAALAEKEYGSLKKAKDAIFLSIGTGIGGAVFLDNNLLVPKKYEGFEIGHMVIKKEGIQCNCGRKGCFEKYASMKALRDKVKIELQKENLTGEELKNIIESNKESLVINEIIEEYISDLSLGICNLINIFEPELISIGGSFAFYEGTLLKRLNNKIKEEKLFNHNSIPQIVLAKLKNDAGIVGAVLD